MSIHLEHGYRVVPMDWIIFEAWSTTLRTEAHLLQQHGLRRLAAHLASRIVDHCVLAPTWDFAWTAIQAEYGDAPRPEIPEGSLQAFVLDVLQSRQDTVLRTQHRDPLYDWSSTVVLIPHDGDLYALLYTEQPAIRQLWRRMPGVTPFPYWNATDGPASLSRKAWETRRRIWEAVLGHDAPDQRGITLTLHAPPTIWWTWESWGAWGPVIPRWAQRIARAARDASWMAYAAAHGYGFGTMTTFDPYFQWSQWLQTPDGQADLAAQQAKMASRLPPRWDRTWMTDDLPTLWHRWHPSPEDQGGPHPHEYSHLP